MQIPKPFEKRFRTKTILHIDDEISDRNMIAIMLKRNLGCEVLQAESALKAFEQLPKMDYLPDLIILDMNMPLMNGKAALKLLRSRPNWDKIPVMACTARGEAKLVRDLLNLGVEDYLIKPVTPQLLILRVAKIFIAQEESSDVTHKPDSFFRNQDAVLDFEADLKL